MDLILLIAILLILGFFAGIEIAYVSANKLSVELKKKQGRRSGIILSELLEKPYTFIGACIAAYSIFLVVYGLLLSRLIEPFWRLTGIQTLEGSYIIKSAAEILIAIILLLTVEFFFRALFRAKSGSVLRIFALLLQYVHTLLKPVVTSFAAISVWVLKYLFNIKMDLQARPFSRIDLEHYYQQTKEAGEETQELNKELFENALSLPGVKIRSCLVPRTEVVAVSIDTPMAAVAQKMIDTRLSRLVVYAGDIDHIEGYIHQQDMLKKAATIQEILLPIPAVPETMSVTDLIAKFNKERRSIAWVVDEFGGTAGIVTMEDLVEEIFGEIKDEYDTEDLVEQKLAEGEYLLSGRLELDYLTEKYGLAFTDHTGAETLSGYIVKKHGSIPREKEKIIIDNYRIEVLAMVNARIEQLRLHKL